MQRSIEFEWLRFWLLRNLVLSHTWVGDTSRSPAGYPELSLAVYGTDYFVSGYPQGPINEAGLAVTALFFRLPN